MSPTKGGRVLPVVVTRLPAFAFRHWIPGHSLRSSPKSIGCCREGRRPTRVSSHEPQTTINFSARHRTQRGPGRHSATLPLVLAPITIPDRLWLPGYLHARVACPLAFESPQCLAAAVGERRLLFCVALYQLSRHQRRFDDYQPARLCTRGITNLVRNRRHAARVFDRGRGCFTKHQITFQRAFGLELRDSVCRGVTAADDAVGQAD